MIEIRKYNNNYRENRQLARELYRLSQKAFKTGSPWTENQFLEDVQQENKEYYLAFDNQFVIGYAAFQRMFEESELLNLAVNPNYQRMGIGKKLLQRALHDQAEEQVEKIFLEVREANHCARNFYLKNGFKEIGRRKSYYHNPNEDAVIMMARISRKEIEND